MLKTGAETPELTAYAAKPKGKAFGL